MRVIDSARLGPPTAEGWHWIEAPQGVVSVVRVDRDGLGLRIGYRSVQSMNIYRHEPIPTPPWVDTPKKVAGRPTEDT